MLSNTLNRNDSGTITRRLPSSLMTAIFSGPTYSTVFLYISAESIVSGLSVCNYAMAATSHVENSLLLIMTSSHASMTKFSSMSSIESFSELFDSSSLSEVYA